ncbi:ABC transporter substrate-binding protein [Gordonia sp. N1V]|uniref:ABC transporter substrate-binding protein n=1 Tax=Gordonia sp. N1V TaxID=3034163 RepID=UPI0023E281A8|nr:ABC transporter substrate-binding protein [Gordonia sp. N1V]MDF3281609.1 ABC transporter substrate-binding protein [Gordonia sp. N1V]
MDRRQFLRGSLILGAASAVVGVGAACGSSSTPTTDRLRIAALGSPTDTLDMGTANSVMTYIAGYNIWDSLALIVGDKVTMQLAESITPNADASVWTVRLKDGLRFSDGSAVTADDVLASLRSLAASPNIAQFYSDLDFSASRATDPRTATLALKRPRADFVEATLAMMSIVMRSGKPDPAIGSGAYTLSSGNATDGYVLRPSPHYRGTTPSLTQVEIRGITDSTARQNALTSGEVDMALELSATGAQTLSSNPSFTVTRLGGAGSRAMSLVLNTRMAPFDDPKVREAMMIAVDRNQLVDVVMRGQGQVGNDLVGKGLPGYDASIPQRTRDVARARSVLAAKGVRTLTLVSSEIAPGTNAASELVKQQLADVGVEVTVQTKDPSSFFSNIPSLLSTPFLTMYYVNRPVAASLPFMTGPTSPYNFSGYSSPALEKALDAATTTVDPAKRAAEYNAAQRDLHDHGAEIIWGYQDTINGSARGVQVAEYSQGIPLLATARFT